MNQLTNIQSDGLALRKSKRKHLSIWDWKNKMNMDKDGGLALLTVIDSLADVITQVIHNTTPRVRSYHILSLVMFAFYARFGGLSYRNNLVFNRKFNPPFLGMN